MKQARLYFTSPRNKQKFLASAFTVLFVSVVIVLNLVVAILTSRMSLQVDVSAGQVFEVSAQTTKLIASIDQPVAIFLCVSESDFLAYENTNQRYKQTGELLRYYGRSSDYITLQYVDLLRQPGFFHSYPEAVIEQGSVVITGNERIRVLSLDEFYDGSIDLSSGEQTIVSYAESKIASAIIGVTTNVNETVLRLSGYSTTASPDGLITLLSDNGYLTSDCDITTGTLDPDASLAILCEPMEDFTQVEVDKLHAFLEKNGSLGGTLIYIPSIEQPKLPRLHSLLADWGIEMRDGLVAETNTNNMYNNNPYFMEVAVSKETYAPLTETKTQQRFMSYQSRPLSPLWAERGARSTSVIATSSSTTVIVALDVDDSFDVTKQVQAEQHVLLLGRRVVYNGTTPHYSNLLVFGGDGMLHQDLIGSANFSNASMTLSVIHSIMGREDVFEIAPIVFSAEKLNISAGKINLLSGLFVLVIPTILLIVSFLIWCKRKNQ